MAGYHPKQCPRRRRRWAGPEVGSPKVAGYHPMRRHGGVRTARLGWGVSSQRGGAGGSPAQAAGRGAKVLHMGGAAHGRARVGAIGGELSREWGGEGRQARRRRGGACGRREAISSDRARGAGRRCTRAARGLHSRWPGAYRSLTGAGRAEAGGRGGGLCAAVRGGACVAVWLCGGVWPVRPRERAALYTRHRRQINVNITRQRCRFREVYRTRTHY